MPKKRQLGQFRNAILCEDVRKELYNKHTAVGIFSGDIIVASFPANIRIAVYAEYIPNQTGTFKAAFKVSLGDELPFTAEASLTVSNATDPVAVVVPGIGVKILTASDLTFEALIGEGDWVTLIRKRVYQGELNAPTAAQSS